MADSDPLDRALYSASDFGCENRVFIAYLLPKLNLTEEVNNHIMSFLDKFSPAKEMRECLKTSISNDDYFAIQLQAKEMHESLIASIRDDNSLALQLQFPVLQKEDPDEVDLNYLFLQQHYHLNEFKELLQIMFDAKNIVNNLYPGDDVNRRSLKAAMFVLDKGKPAKQVINELMGIQHITYNKLPFDSTRCDSCTRRNTRHNTQVLECSLCSRTCCVDCRLQHLARDETRGCFECLSLARCGDWEEEDYSSDDEYLEESEREAKRRRIEARSQIRATYLSL